MSNRSPLLNIIFQSLNKVTRSVVRDFGEIENLQVSPNSLERFVSKTKNKISNSLLSDLTKSRPEWGIKLNENKENIKDKYYWIVDTLNGQFNFSRKSTALLSNGVLKILILIFFANSNNSLCHFKGV